MHLVYIIGLISTCINPNCNTADSLIYGIENLYKSLVKTNSIEKTQILGEFILDEANKRNGKQSATLFSNGKASEISYVRCDDAKKNDYIVFNSQKVILHHKLDLQSVKTYTLNLSTKFIVFLGKAESASGTGVQVTYFVVNKLSSSGKIIQTFEFETRFGNINSLVELGGNGKIGYWKMVNGPKVDTYLLTINSLTFNLKLSSGEALVKYELNDRFIILNNNLRLK